jgi:hypothetical protein
MKQLLTLATILFATHVCLAQEPVRLTPTTETSVVITYQGQSSPATIQHGPTPVVVAQECKTTICVTEPKKNTKTVYTSVCKEYCVPQCSLCSWFTGDCGCGGCEKHTKNILVKKKVPTCDTTQCVLKEVPAGYCAPCGK